RCLSCSQQKWALPHVCVIPRVIAFRKLRHALDRWHNLTPPYRPNTLYSRLGAWAATHPPPDCWPGYASFARGIADFPFSQLINTRPRTGPRMNRTALPLRIGLKLTPLTPPTPLTPRRPGECGESGECVWPHDETDRRDKLPSGPPCVPCRAD